MKELTTIPESDPRIPRPKNSTTYAINYTKSKKYLFKRRLHETVTKAYINADHQYNGTFMDLQTFSNTTGIPINVVQRTLFNQLKDTQIITDEHLIGLAQGLKLRALNRSLADGTLTQGILNPLALKLSTLIAMGKQPIGLINSASRMFEISQKHTQMLLDIAAHLSKTPDVLIHQNILNQNTYQSNYLTIEKALQLMESTSNSGQLLDDSSRKALEEAYDISSLPDIRAKNNDEGVVGNAAALVPLSPEILLTESWKDK